MKPKGPMVFNPVEKHRYFARASYQESDLGDYITRQVSDIVELAEGFNLKDVSNALGLAKEAGVAILSLSRL